MKVTIAEVAKRAGVAKSTVSRYLNGGYVSEETSAKIKAIIEETHYEPNTFAQSLKAKNTNLIGVIVPRLNSYSAALILKGLEETLRTNGYQLLISNTEQVAEREIESLYGFANQKVAGIILFGTSLTTKHKKAIMDIDLPVLSIGQEYKGLPCLVYDDFQAGLLVGEYLTEGGHRKIAYLSVPENDIAVGLRRKEGVQKATENVADCQIDYFETDFQMKSALELFSSLIEENRLDGKTAVICATDNIALGVMKAARLHKLRIPEDISVIGFGDYDIADLVGLSTVHYPYYEAGKKAAAGLIGLTQGKRYVAQEYEEVHLVVRDSVKRLTD